ncbi:putative ribonuclease H-like domain-containing protein, partial [Tanacetum coccineum]
ENQTNPYAGTLEVTNSAGTLQTPNANASEEADENKELIVVPTTIKHSATKVRPRKSSTNSKEEKSLTELQNLQPQEKEAFSTGISEDTLEILAFRRDLDQLAQKHLREVTTTKATSPNSVTSGSEPANTQPVDQDDSDMPELTIFNKPQKGIFDKASYDEEGMVHDFNNLPTEVAVSPILTLRIHNIHLQSQILGAPKSSLQTRSRVKQTSGEHALVSYVQKQQMNNHKDQHHCLFASFLSQKEPKKISKALKDDSWVEAMQEELLQFRLQQVWILVDLPHREKEEGNDYVEFLLPVARIVLSVIFRHFAHLWGSLVYQMDVKSAFLYGTIDEEVYVSQPPSFVDHDHPKKVYKVVKALYGLHQAPRILKKAWYSRVDDKDFVYLEGKKDIMMVLVANSTTEAEYVAAASCCGQVLWIQKQMLDYGFNYNEFHKSHSIMNGHTLSIVKNPVYHSKTKHIEIRHHFIRDSYEKKLIRVEKIHTDFNVADLLTKAFDGPRFNFLVVNIGHEDQIELHSLTSSLQFHTTYSQPAPTESPTIPPTPVTKTTSEPSSPSPAPEHETMEHPFEQLSPEHQPSSPRHESAIPQTQAPTHTHEAETGHMSVDDLFQLVPQLMTRIDSLEKDLKQTKQTMGNAIVKLEDEGAENSSKQGRNLQKDESEVFETPKQGKSSGETDISPQGLEAAETLAEVLSQIKTKRRNVKTGVRRRLDAEDVSTSFEGFKCSSGFTVYYVASEKISSSGEYVSASQREGKQSERWNWLSKKLTDEELKDVSVPKEKDKESVKREKEFEIKKPILRYTNRKSLARKGLHKKSESGTEEDVEAYMEERVDEPSSEEFPMSLIPQGPTPAKIVKW